MLRNQNDAKANRIHSIDLFKEADKKAIEHLEQAADEVTVKAGTVVITQGQRHNEGYLLLEGTVAVEVDGEHVADIGAVEVFGEIGLFANTPASATIRATTDLSLMVIPHNRFDQILDDNPALTKAVAKKLAMRLHEMDAHHGEGRH
ncbi:MAG: cyclic nucleotide-binding domain-containing protein [Acidimicrobiales bacterium]